MTPPIPPEKRLEMATRYSQGENEAKVAAAFGLGPGAARQAALRLNLPVRHRREITLRHDAFNVLCPDAFYWLGFLMADGCVQGKCITLNLSARDREHVEKFHAFIGSNHKIQATKSQPKKGASYFPMARLAVTSAHMVAAIAAHGIVENKSATAKSSAQCATNRDFWRGVIDGDGSIFPFVRNGRKGYCLALCGSKNLLTQFREFVLKYIPRYKPAIIAGHGKNHWQIVFSGKGAAAVANILYKNPDTVLTRKYILAQEIAAFYP